MAGTDHAAELLDRLQRRALSIGVIGLGYVGLPLLGALHNAGLRVIGFDTDPEKPDMLRRGENYLDYLGEDFCRPFAGSDRFDATTDMTRLGEPDVLLICVPTPLGPHQEPDLQYVRQTTGAIAATLRPGQLVVLESTTYPGTTRQDVLPILLESGSPDRPRAGFALGRDLFVAYSPEREDPGRQGHSTGTIPKLVGGLDETSRRLASALYECIVPAVVEVPTVEVAEAAKLLENIFRAVNIALANEMKLVLDPMGIDVWEVIAAASTKPFGFMPFYPGPGMGGHCIPIDPFYLSWKAKEHGVPARFIELAGQVNTAMPVHVVRRVTEALNEDARPVRGSRVLVLGLAYKPNISDVRESPAYPIIRRLQAMGAEVSYADPHVPEAHPIRHHGLRMTAVEPTPQQISSADIVIVVTDHDEFDYRAIGAHARLIVDTRNAFRKRGVTPAGRLVLA